MIIYAKSENGNLRVFWVDEKGEKNPAKAMRSFLKSLSEVNDGKSVGAGRGNQRQPPAQTGAAQSNQVEPMNAALRPTILYRERAVYTEEARNEKVSGTVVLSVVFRADGKIGEIRVIHGLPYGLTDNAIRATRKIRFNPAIRDGKPLSVRGTVEFTFSLY